MQSAHGRERTINGRKSAALFRPFAMGYAFYRACGLLLIIAVQRALIDFHHTVQLELGAEKGADVVVPLGVDVRNAGHELGSHFRGEGLDVNVHRAVFLHLLRGHGDGGHGPFVGQIAVPDFHGAVPLVLGRLGGPAFLPLVAAGQRGPVDVGAAGRGDAGGLGVVENGVGEVGQVVAVLPGVGDNLL